MTDVQVSNARRIIFTVLALVSFWVMASNAYWMGLDWATGTGAIAELVIAVALELDRAHPNETWWWQCWFDYAWIVVGLTLALVPTILLWVSVPIRFWSSNILACGALFTLSISLIFWLGEVDHSETVDTLVIEQERLSSSEWRRFLTGTGKVHAVSWLWFILPIILTSAFVIAGAWRRWVREQTG